VKRECQEALGKRRCSTLVWAEQPRILATAQAAAECLRRAGIESVVADRSLPLIFSEVIREAGIRVVCDLEMGVLERRRKDEQEIEWLRESQRVTEGAMEMACHLVAKARPKSDGTLVWEGRPLTSERVRAAIDHWLLERAFYNPPCIISGGLAGADCHDRGSGALRTGEPVIIDIFPQCQETRYYGDCTRTVVNGTIPEPVARMHATVVDVNSKPIGGICVVLNRWHCHTDNRGIFHWAAEAPVPQSVAVKIYKQYRGYQAIRKTTPLSGIDGAVFTSQEQ